VLYCATLFTRKGVGQVLWSASVVVQEGKLAFYHQPTQSVKAPEVVNSWRFFQLPNICSEVGLHFKMFQESNLL